MGKRKIYLIIVIGFAVLFTIIISIPKIANYISSVIPPWVINALFWVGVFIIFHQYLQKRRKNTKKGGKDG